MRRPRRSSRRYGAVWKHWRPPVSVGSPTSSAEGFTSETATSRWPPGWHRPTGSPMEQHAIGCHRTSARAHARDAEGAGGRRGLPGRGRDARAGHERVIRTPSSDPRPCSCRRLPCTRSPGSPGWWGTGARWSPHRPVPTPRPSSGHVGACTPPPPSQAWCGWTGTSIRRPARSCSRRSEPWWTPRLARGRKMSVPPPSDVPMPWERSAVSGWTSHPVPLWRESDRISPSRSRPRPWRGRPGMGPVTPGLTSRAEQSSGACARAEISPPARSSITWVRSPSGPHGGCPVMPR